MAHKILAEASASISELKRNPMATVQSGEGFPVVILNRNEPAFYCIPAAVYEEIIEKLDDLELTRLVEERKGEKRIKVKIDDL